MSEHERLDEDVPFPVNVPDPGGLPSAGDHEQEWPLPRALSERQNAASVGRGAQFVALDGARYVSDGENWIRQPQHEVMGKWERLAHYVLGVVQGKIVPSDTSNLLGEAWAYYVRLGGDPGAAEWPVVSLEDPLPDDVTAQLRGLRESLDRLAPESPSARRAANAIAQALGERAPHADPGRPVVTTPVPDGPSNTGASLIAEGEGCDACFISDGIEVALEVQQDGTKRCPNCGGNGSNR
jgi:hypothetical protein